LFFVANLLRRVERLVERVLSQALRPHDSSLPSVPLHQEKHAFKITHITSMGTPFCEAEFHGTNVSNEHLGSAYSEYYLTSFGCC
jgi:hypothetical protein